MWQVASYEAHRVGCFLMVNTLGNLAGVLRIGFGMPKYPMGAPLLPPPPTPRAPKTRATRATSPRHRLTAVVVVFWCVAGGR